LYFLDIVQEETQALGWTQEQAYGYLWGILCTGYHDQIDLKYELLLGAEELLREKSRSLSRESQQQIEIDLQLHWGDYYIQTGGYNHALDIYETLAAQLESQSEWTNEEFKRLVICYQYLASIHRQRGSYKLAIDFYFKSLDYERQYYAKIDDPRKNESLAYSRIATAYRLMGERRKALAYYRSAFTENMEQYQAAPVSKSRVRKHLISQGLEMGKYYNEIGKLDSGLYYLEKVTPLSNPNDPVTQELRLEKARILSNKRRYRGAIDTLEQAIATVVAKQSLKADFLLGQLHTGIGDIYQQQGKYEAALSAYQQALQLLAEDFTGPDFQQNPKASLWIAPKELLYTLRQKAKILAHYPPTEDPTWLSAAWATAQVGMDLIDSIKISYTSDYDKQYLLEESYPLYELALQITHRLGDTYAEAAFRIMERSKAVVLFAAVRDLHARTYAGVPEEELETLRRTQYQLARVDARLEQTKTEERRISLGEQRLELKQTYQRMIRSFESNYPDYYHLKYDQQLPDLSEIHASGLLDQRTLVEYFVGEQHVYAIRIDGETEAIDFFQLPWNKQLNQWATDLKEDIYKNNDPAFSTKASALYDALLAPVLAGTSPEKLLIIPDGVLGYLPFDILLTAPVPAEQEGNFRNYPFLMAATTLSQSFSLSMLSEMQAAVGNQQEELLAFAPTFSNQDLIAERSAREELGELLFNQAEAEGVLQWFGGELIAARQATKDQFLTLAPNYQIYHIASHAVVDDESPNNSFIAFTDEGEDAVEHSRLYIYEILAQSFPAKLVVLSACETGIGKVLRGEGIMSLARAFSYAGAQSLVTSLWNVNDQSGQELMVEFYRQLETGLPKDEALREAKLAYLQNAPDNARTHPKYWAAFVPIGNMEPIIQNTSWKWGMGVFGLLALVFLFLRRRKVDTD
ncbi:MAG: CHAT domain-containing protein, partial [Saprospiraceae bacterium]|nr:CHAT domain-containing protein [Saprospiraceae bacterium]